MRGYLTGMRTLLLAIAISVMGVSGASAFCQSFPDNAASYNVENNTAQALCLQQELARQSAQQAEQARIDAMLAQMRADAERQQRLVSDQLNQSLFPPVPVF
jgi:hypothetical protein